MLKPAPTTNPTRNRRVAAAVRAFGQQLVRLSDTILTRGLQSARTRAQYATALELQDQVNQAQRRDGAP